MYLLFLTSLYTAVIITYIIIMSMVSIENSVKLHCRWCQQLHYSTTVWRK